MKAEEARLISIEVTTETLESVFNEIKEAAGKGVRCIRIYGDLEEIQRKALIHLGYRVIYNSACMRYDISW
jgi:hypothetical protein